MTPVPSKAIETDLVADERDGELNTVDRSAPATDPKQAFVGWPTKACVSSQGKAAGSRRRARTILLKACQAVVDAELQLKPDRLVF